MSWHLFDRIRALARNAHVYQQERLFQDQPNLDRIVSGGEVLDFNQQQALLDQTNLQINRLERYKDYDQMDETGEISLALDLYADESSLVDPERKHTLIIKAQNNKVQEELEDLFYNQLLIDNNARPMVRYLCKYGDSPFEIIPTVDRDGVAALKFMNIYNFTRVETKFGDLVGFFYQDEVMEQPVFLHPWQVMHLRLTDYGNLYHPYGRSIVEGGRKAFKQLRLMEDAALIYRITRAPEKRVFKIPIGNIPAKDVPEFMQGIARIFKQQRFYDPRTGKFNERWSPLIQEDDFFLPQRPDGTSPSIDTLKGAENLDQIADIEYFKKKMIAPTKIPFKRVGIGEGAGEAQEKSLASSDAEFAKAVQWVQREVATGLTKVAICHLAMAGYSVEDLKNFEIGMSASSAIDELYRMETWQGRTSVMADLKDLGWFPKEWIVTRFTDLTPDEIKEICDIMAENEPQLDGGGGGGGGGGLGGLGGADEMEMPDMGGAEESELPEIEGEEQGGVPGGAPGGAPEGAAMPGVAESLRREERRLLREMRTQDLASAAGSRRQSRQRTLFEFVEKVDSRINRRSRSMLPNILSTHELDGLVRGKGKKAKHIFESSLDHGTRLGAAREFYKLLTDDDGPDNIIK